MRMRIWIRHGIFDSDLQADLNLDFYLMRMPIQLFTLMRIPTRILLFCADPDPACYPDADPDPGSQNYPNSCGSGSGSTTLLLGQKHVESIRSLSNAYFYFFFNCNTLKVNWEEWFWKSPIHLNSFRSFQSRRWVPFKEDSRRSVCLVDSRSDPVLSRADLHSSRNLPGRVVGQP